MSTTYPVNTNPRSLDLTGQHLTTDNVESRHVPQEFVSYVPKNVHHEMGRMTYLYTSLPRFFGPNGSTA